MPAFTRQDIFYASLTDKITIAQELFRTASPVLLSMKTVEDGISLLTERLTDLQQTMNRMDLGRFCGKCAGDRENGGCCSLFMADENDSIQLLINLLTGCDITPQRDDAHECIFLGIQGCTLSYKPFFCLNYLCSHIRLSATPNSLAGLDRATGLLLQQQYTVEQCLLDALTRQGLLL